VRVLNQLLWLPVIITMPLMAVLVIIIFIAGFLVAFVGPMILVTDGFDSLPVEFWCFNLVVYMVWILYYTRDIKS